MHELEERIRTRAYEIWEREGQTGHCDAHWFVAEQEVHATLTSALAVDAPLAAPAKPKAPRRANTAAEAAAGSADAAPKRKTKARTPAS